MTAISGIAHWQRLAALLPHWVDDTSALAAHLDMTVAELEQLCITAQHQSADQLILAAKVSRAKRLLHQSEASIAAIAADCGFSNTTTMDQSLLETIGVNSVQWRASLGAKALTARLPKRFRRVETLAYLGRDKHSITIQRNAGDRFAIAWWHNEHPLTINLAFHRHQVNILLQGDRGRIPDSAGPGALNMVAKLLGTHSPTVAFEQRAGAEPLVNRLIKGRRGLRVSLTPTTFDAVIWSIIGQQVSLSFAYQMLHSISELCGAKAPGGLKTMPLAAELAQLVPTRLTALKFSRAKAQYVIATAQAACQDQLRLTATLQHTADDTYAALISQRGLGPWSVNYIMMRGFGFADCVPLGDAGLRRALSAFLAADSTSEAVDSDSARLDSARMAAVMAPFKPHRSLASFHLWRWLDG